MANKVIAATVQFNGIKEAIGSISALQKELASLRADQVKQDPSSARYKELAELVALYTAELKLLQDEQKKVNQSFQEVQLAAGSYAAVQEETKRLTEQLKGMAVGVNATQEQYDELKAKIKDNNTALAAMNAELKAVSKTQEEAIGGAAGSIFELKKQLKDLQEQQGKVAAGTDEYNQLSAEIASTTSEIKALEAEQKRVNAAFEESKLAAGSYAQLTAETKRLTEQLKGMAVGVNATQEQYDELKAKIKDNNTALAAMNAELKAVSKTQEEAIGGAAGSIFELKKQLKDLQEQQGKVAAGTDEYNQLSAEIASTTSEIKALEAEQKRVNAAFEESKLAAGSYAQLTAETKRLTEQLKGMAVGVNATQEEFDGVLGKIKSNNEAITDLNREMRNSKSISERFREGAVAAFKDVALSIVAGVSALEGFEALKGIGELGLGLEQGFAQVNTVAQLSEQGLADLQNQVLETAKTSTANLEEVPGALFKILSATGDVAESQKILEASLKATKVGFTDIGSASDAGTAIFGAFKGQVKDITEVFDVLFRTQKEGVLTFADLAKGIPQIAPEASKLKISLQETTAALATLTKAGTPVEQAVTQLKAGFKDLSDVSKIKGLESIGVKVFDAAGNANKFNDIVGQLSKSLDGLTDKERTDKLGKVGFSGEATGSIITLVNNLKTFDEVSKSIVEGSAGELDRQFEKSANTLDDLKAATNELQVTLIQELQPAFVTIGRSLIAVVSGFAKLIGLLFDNKGIVLLLASAYLALNAAKVQTLVTTAAERLGQLAVNVIDKASIVLKGLQAAATTAYGIATDILTGKITLAEAAQLLLNLAMEANPIGLVIAGVTALGAALLIYSERSKEVTAAEKERARISAAINDAVKATNEEIGKETAGLELLVRGIKDETRSKAEKKAITDQLLSQYGKYLSELDKEAVKAGEVELAYRKIKQAITDNIIARQKSEAIEKLFGEQLAARQQSAFQLTKAFGGTADEIIRSVEEFSKLGPAIQDAVSKGQGLKLVNSQDFTDAQKEAIKLFDQIAAQQKKADAAGKTSAVVAAVKRIQTATTTLDQGLADIETKFGQLGGSISGGGTFTGISEGANAAAQSVTELKAQLQALQKAQEETSTNSQQWRDQEVEIKKVQAAIEAITGASKASQAASKKSADELKKEADAERDAAEKRNNTLLELRRQLSEQLLANEDDETAKLLEAEAQRYDKEFKAVMDQAEKVTNAKGASREEIAQAQQLSDAVLEQLQIEHYGKLNDITAAGLKAELEAQAKADAEALAQQQRVLGLRLETVEQEIANEEKNFERRKQLINLQKELRIRQLELETSAALKEAKTDEERTAIMANEAAKRIGILKDTAQQIQDEKAKQGPLLARLLGVSPDELAKIGQVFQEFQQVLSQAIDQFFASRLESLGKLIDAQTERIAAAVEATQKQVEKVKSLEERLTTATGDRRQRLIALIEAEKKRQQELFDQQVKQEKVKAALEAKKAELEKKQALIRKAQSIASAIINTAESVTKVLATTPPPLGPILAVAYGVLGAAQIALISAQKFAKGGKVSGPSHDLGGVTMAVPSQNRYVNLEGGEFITKVDAVKNNEAALHRINTEGHNTRFSLVAENQRFASGGIVAPNFQAINDALKSGPTGTSDKLDLTNALLAQLLSKPSKVAVVDIIKGIQSVQVDSARARF